MSVVEADRTSTGYAGDISVADGWKRLAEDRRALLVDVRSEAEWAFVGQPDRSSLCKAPLAIAWQHFPGMALNPSFVAEVSAAAPERDRPLLFLCRSGARSRAAAIALAACGYAHCYNLTGGFEGDLDQAGHRGHLAGWKVAGLPWSQR